MNYKIQQDRNDTIVVGVRNFNPAQVLECGQCFRWIPEGTGYTGIAHGRRLRIELKGENLILKDVSLNEYEYIWKDYFDLSRDYDLIHRHYFVDTSLTKAVNYSPGLRVMRQDPWETLISFILSQNSNIPRIQKMISQLCLYFGEALQHTNGPISQGRQRPCDGYAFPTPDVLAACTPEKLAPIKTGYRAPYIIDAACKVASGEIDLTALQSQASEDVYKALLTIHGVGPKVAECVLLFGFGRVERCPMDVWMKKVMSTLYPNGFPDNLKPTAGIAQQYLFHYARMRQM